MAVRTIDGYEAARLIEEEGAVVLDVREASDYAAGHIEGALCVPFAGFSERMAMEVAPDKSKPIIVYCYVGGRSAALSQVLDRLGYESVFNMGGVGAWPFDLVV